jgi:hypothetical protein
MLVVGGRPAAGTGPANFVTKAASKRCVVRDIDALAKELAGSGMMQVFKPCSRDIAIHSLVIPTALLASPPWSNLWKFPSSSPLPSCAFRNPSLARSLLYPRVRDSCETDHSFNWPRRPLASENQCLSDQRKVFLCKVASPSEENSSCSKQFEMKLTLAVLATVATTVVAQGVTEILTPSSPPPPKCNPSYSGTFGLSVQALSKRSIEEVCFARMELRSQCHD